MKPSDFKSEPMNSIFQKSEYETVARNIMVILARLGDEWRYISWLEYKIERQKDGNFSEKEQYYFAQVVDYCVSPERAAEFSPLWKI